MVDECATEQYGRPEDHVGHAMLSKALLRAFTEAAAAQGVPLLRMSQPRWDDRGDGIGLDATIRDCDADEFRLLRSRVSSLLVKMAKERAARARAESRDSPSLHHG